MIDGSTDRAFDGSQPRRRVRVTRPETLLRRILSNVNLGDRYRNVRLIQRGDRPIMEAICARVARSGIPGVYVPDPMMAGITSLAELVACWVDSAGDEEGVAAGLERLSRFGFIEVTDYSCILLPSVIKSAAVASANNGRMSIGRRRNGESKAVYSARAKAHRAAIQAQGAHALRQPKPWTGTLGSELPGTLSPGYCAAPCPSMPRRERRSEKQLRPTPGPRRHRVRRRPSNQSAAAAQPSIPVRQRRRPPPRQRKRLRGWP